MELLFTNSNNAHPLHFFLKMLYKSENIKESEMEKRLWIWEYVKHNDYLEYNVRGRSGRGKCALAGKVISIWKKKEKGS